MSIVEQIQQVFVGAVRPVSGLRGMGRVCGFFNHKFLAAGAPPIQVARMRDGTLMRLDLRSRTEWYSFYSGRYDESAVSLIRKLLSRLDGDFLDVGGNVGMYAVRIAATLGDGRRSVCFEPMPNNAERIRENARLNGVEDRVKVHEIALSDTDGQTDLVLREDFELGSATGNASIAISDFADGHYKKIGVRMRRFDDVLAEMGDATFPVVKVDIEGHEDFFLRGAQNWLRRDRPIILTEVNNWYFEQRRTTSSIVFAKSLPEGYEIALLKWHGTACTLEPCGIDDLAKLGMIETCLLVPAERRAELDQAVG
ncbi:MAG: FkbM family methyltransferase [Pseudorhodobacter sp.]|nr:FkbM family methyltransferase [Pseudorhodobacter sp.]